jgi:DNA invertase Pin-like site-specific DNA recombinase
VQWIEDAGHSASTLARPGIQRALALLATGQATTLVVARLDRLSRSLLDFAGLMEQAKRQGWAIVAGDLGVDMTEPAGEMLASVLAAFASYERALIARRTKDALAAARARGVRLGRPVTLPADIRQRVVLLAGNGKSHAAIARELNAAGVPTVSGAPWHRSTVRRVVQSVALDALAQEATA